MDYQEFTNYQKKIEDYVTRTRNRWIWSPALYHLSQVSFVIYQKIEDYVTRTRNRWIWSPALYHLSQVSFVDNYFLLESNQKYKKIEDYVTRTRNRWIWSPALYHLSQVSFGEISMLKNFLKANKQLRYCFNLIKKSIIYKKKIEDYVTRTRNRWIWSPALYHLSQVSFVKIFSMNID
ncbi:hypothetical protein ABPG72_004307, partial [Tetrahymena utriculariae]